LPLALLGLDLLDHPLDESVRKAALARTGADAEGEMQDMQNFQMQVTSLRVSLIGAPNLRQPSVA
jgi:hypothetical protein